MIQEILFQCVYLSMNLGLYVFLNKIFTLNFYGMWSEPGIENIGFLDLKLFFEFQQNKILEL